jgi:tRNA-(ms[2]io[6]A)-hydroxylase
MAAGDGKRRLPVLQPKSPEAEEAELRPPWHWVGIGALAILLALVPLLMLAQYLARLLVERITPPGQTPTPRAWLVMGIVLVTAQLLPLAVSALLGGLFVGRFGGRAGKKEATAAGLGVGVFAALFTLPSMVRDDKLLPWLLSSAVILSVAALCSRLGAALGLRSKRKSG